MTQVLLSPSFVLSGVFEEGRRRFLLKAGLNRVGSLRSSEILLEARGVSKRHAILVVQKGRLVLEDLASKNGTFVNDARVESATVKPGDQLRFGEIALRLEEVSQADGELAIVLDDPARAERSSAFAIETSRLPSLSGALATAKWLAVVEGLVERLCREGKDGFTSALALLVTRVGARGAWLLEYSGGDSPVVLASYGEIEEGSTRQIQLAISGASDSEDGVKVQSFRAESTSGAPLAVAAAAAEDRLVLALLGEVSERPETAYLLRTLLHLIGRFRPRLNADLTVSSSPERESSGLSLPDGYLRCESPKMTALYQQTQAVARSNLPILVLGETGVGKEGIARILHLSSGRRNGPFIAINCAAIPADLLEAELFGIAKAVATGVAERKGKFMLAGGGTLFLDEIGDMSQDLQAKLLRTLQEKEIQPVGSPTEPIDVRVIAATNTSLLQRIEAGTFRRDLYYRLAGFVLTVPPLREHKEDVPALVEHFLRRYSGEAGKSLRGMTLEALRHLTDSFWPGNIRELEYEVRRLVYFCPNHQAIDSSMLSPGVEVASQEAVTPDPGSAEPKSAQAPATSRELELATIENLRLADIEKQVVQEALARCAGNRTHAARLLGISREALRRRIARHQVEL